MLAWVAGSLLTYIYAPKSLLRVNEPDLGYGKFLAVQPYLLEMAGNHNAYSRIELSRKYY